MMSHRVMIDIERADLGNDEMKFATYWQSYRNGMVFHALASFGTFRWDNFRQWLQKIAENDDFAREALVLFQDHPAITDLPLA